MPFQTHSLQIILFGPFTYEPKDNPGPLKIVSLQYIYIYIYKFPTIDFKKKIIKYKTYFKYMLNMVGRVGFGGFVILWPKPNPTHYKNFLVI